MIEADEGLVVEPGPSGASPITRPIPREVDARDRYAYHAVHAPSEFVSGTVDTPVRDDTGAAEAEAIALRTTSEAGVFEGHVLIPRFTTYYQVGDRISSIQGRDLGLRTDNGGSTWAPVYPVVVSRRWDLDGKQTTTLTLSDGGIDRRRYAVPQPRPHVRAPRLSCATRSSSRATAITRGDAMGATGNLSVSLQYTEAARLRQRDADAADERTRTGEPALAGA